MLGALGLCGALVLGSMALFAWRQLDGFAMNATGSAAGQEAPHPAQSRPDEDGACTQAHIDRTTGETIVSDCPPRATGAATLAAWLAEPASPR